MQVVYSFSNEDRVLVTGWTRLADDGSTDDDSVLDSKLPKEIRRYYLPDERGLREITDEDLPGLNYDGRVMVQNYKPATEDKSAVGDKCLVTIYGRWLQVSVTNVGTKPLKSLRFFVRASVF